MQKKFSERIFLRISIDGFVFIGGEKPSTQDSLNIDKILSVSFTVYFIGFSNRGCVVVDCIEYSEYESDNIYS